MNTKENNRVTLKNKILTRIAEASTVLFIIFIGYVWLVVAHVLNITPIWQFDTKKKEIKLPLAFNREVGAYDKMTDALAGLYIGDKNFT